MADDSCRTEDARGQGLREHLLREIDEARARIALLERQLARKLPTIELAQVALDPALVAILPAATARRLRVLPLFVSKVLTVAVADPSDPRTIEEIEDRTGFLVQPVAAPEAALAEALDRYYGPADSSRGARPSVSSRLRLVWPRKRHGDGGGPAGGRPAA